VEHKTLMLVELSLGKNCLDFSSQEERSRISQQPPGARSTQKRGQTDRSKTTGATRLARRAANNGADVR